MAKAKSITRPREVNEQLISRLIVQKAMRFMAILSDYVNAQKQRNEPRPELPSGPPKPHTLRWYWTLYRHSDHWLGDLSVGQEGLSDSTRLQRTRLIESLLPENGERPFGVLT
jgi:hypothetical protein